MNYKTAESQYLEIAARILTNGQQRPDRTGTGTFSLFSPPEINIDLKQGFPLLTTKKISFKNIAHELFWMLNGDTNIAYLLDKKCNIWDEWADEHGELGRVYGAQWRKTKRYTVNVSQCGTRIIPLHKISYIDQIGKLIQDLIHNPYSRRHIVSAWNPSELEDMALTPCHAWFQCYIDKNGLSLKMYQRSADWFLGVPYNIASYALLAHLLAYRIGKPVHRLVITYGDAHIYKNHEQQVKKQLKREAYELPTLTVNKITNDLKNMQLDYITLDNYQHHSAIRGKVSV